MSENLKKDYEHFKTEIQKGLRTTSKISGTLEVSFKKHHKSLYAITLLLMKLKENKTNENEYIFFQEIISDFLNISKLITLGFEIPSLVLLRRVIENFYNHIYYFDHKIEYLYLQRGKNEYTPIDKLKLYFDSHPVFFDRADQTLKDYNQHLFNEYQDLCKVVHSKGSDSMNLSLTLKELRTEFDLDKFYKRLYQIELYLVYLLFKFHKTIKLTPVEKAILVSLVPADKRGSLND